MADQAQFTVDVTRARAKISKLRGMDQLFKRKLANWSTGTVAILKRVAQNMKKAGPGRKTGHLARNIGSKIVESRGEAGVLIGTGTQVGQRPVVYASIQDKGGKIRPRKAKYLAVPFPGVKGVPANYRPDSFVIKSRKGRLIIVQRVGKQGKLKPLFSLLKEVTIPATAWFTNVVRGRTSELTRIMAPTTLVDELLGYGDSSMIQD